MNDWIEWATLLLSILGLFLLIGFADNLNTIEKLEPMKQGYVQEVRELTCIPQHEVIWVKKND